jgi:hypothetical protein
MNKKNYILTLNDYGFKVEAWDNYGKYTCVYEKTREDASDFIMKWWEMSEENKKKDSLWNKAMLNMIEIDKKYNINKGNSDGLD